MTPITDVGPDISPDGISLTRQPTSDIDRAIKQAAAQSNTNKDVAIKDLPVEPEAPADNDTVDKTETQIEGDDVTLDDFLNAAGKELTKTDENKEEKSLEQNTDKDKKTPDDKSTDKLDQKVVTAKADKTADRDYSDIDEEHKDMFRKMHNDPYNLLKPIYKEHKTLKTENEKLKKDFETTDKAYKELKSKGPQLPDSYYENPNGYLLNPDFQFAVRDQNTAQVIFNHWQKQYQDVANGAKEVEILNYDNNGNLAITGKVKADAGVEAQLLTYITHAQHNLINKQASVQSIMQSHQGKSSEAIKSFNDQISKEYSGFDTPENKPIYEPLIKQELESLHPTFRNSPLAMALAKSRVMNMALGQLLKKAAEEKKGATNANGNGNTTNGNTTNGNGNKKTAQRAKQPSAAEVTGEVNGKAADDDADNVTMDDFNRVKAID